MKTSKKSVAAALLFAAIVIIVSFNFIVEVKGQGVGINTSNTSPDPSAGLDVNFTNKGTLITRMTTFQRDAISNPAQALLIYNTTTRCFETYEIGLWQTIWCSCNPPAASGTISGPATVCQGQNGVAYSVGAIAYATGYVWTLPSGATIASGGNTNSITVNYSGSASSGNIIVYGTSMSCGSGAVSANYPVTVNAPPTTANAGADINPACGVSTVTLAGNTPSIGTGNWSVVSGTATITTPGSPTSGVTGLAVPGTATLRWTISNSPCAASTDDVVITTTACFSCPSTLTINHNAGVVAPVTKSVTYGVVVSNLSGANKCWITRNLGATNQATSEFDGTENAAGWYWQFNRKQGWEYKTSRVPTSPSWNSTGDQGAVWLAANDPCTIELGAGWRLPTQTEWENVKANGGWTNISDAFATNLKFHAGGRLAQSTGTIEERGSWGRLWSSNQSAALPQYGMQIIGADTWISITEADRGSAAPVRCLRD